jgi:hypothetical protein
MVLSGFSANEPYALVNDTGTQGVFLDFVPAPEPATLVLLTCGGLVFLPRWRGCWAGL